MLATEHLYLQTDRHMDAICDEAIYNVLIMSLLLDCVGKDIMLSGCLSPPPCLFVRPVGYCYHYILL